MELFFLMSEDISPRVVKVNTDKSTQNVIKDIFLEAKDSFFDDKTSVDFTIDYKVSSCEYFLIPDFSEGLEILAAIERPSAIAEWDSNGMSMHNVKAIFTGKAKTTDETETEAYIQYFDKRQIIDTGKTFVQFITQQKNQFSSLKKPGFSIGEKIDAVLTSSGEFSFNSFYIVRRFFDMSEYYREATQDDLDSFVNHEKLKFKCADTFKDIADSQIKRKILLINGSGILNSYSIEELVQCATSINISLEIEGVESDKKLLVPEGKREIKQLLNFLDQGYFNTLITKEIMFTNSKRKPN